MEQRRIGDSDLRVSAVGIGTWAMGDDFFGSVDDRESADAIRAALDNGINLIDTAPAYGAGHAEEVVGTAIKGRRDKAVIATKCGIVRTKTEFLRNLKPDSIRQEIDDSLRRLGVDVIDLYQIHWPDPETPIEDSLEALMEAKEAGKFRYLGVSNFPPGLMDTVRGITGIVSTQPQYSMLNRKIEADIIPYALEKGMGILSYGTLAGGVLTGKFREVPTFEEGDNRARFYDFFKEPVWSQVQTLLKTLDTIAADRGVSAAQVAINWTFQQRGISSVLVGAKRPSQAESNAAAGDWMLSTEELGRISAAIDETVGAE